MTLKLSNFAVCPATKELRQIHFDIGNVAPDKKYNANKGQQEDARRRLRGMCGFQKELRVCWMEMEVE